MNKKCVVNVRNVDDRCLLYALASALHARDVHGHRDRPQVYAQDLTELKLDGVAFPASVEDAASISEMNELPLHVLGLDVTDPTNTHYTIEHHNRVRSSRKPIILLRLHEGSSIGHFVWIRRFNAFVRAPMSRMQLHCCPTCLQRFKREAALNNHLNKGACIPTGETVKKLPSRDKSDVRFTSIAKQLDAPFVVYADIESVLLPTAEAHGSQSNAVQTHVPCCVGAQLVSRYPAIMASVYVFFTGADCIEKFLEWLFDVERAAVRAVANPKPLVMSSADCVRAAAQTDCNICSKTLDGDRVRDHDHLSGAFRGVAHSACNIAYSFRHFKLPVFFHNLAGYDAHFILQHAGTFKRKMSCLAKTTEKMVSFSIGCCVFKDSMQFLVGSLAKLVETIAPSDFTVHDAAFASTDAELRALLRQKGVMPYDWLDSFEKLDERSLPPRESFTSSLTKTECSLEDYTRAQRVWTLARCVTMHDYVALYLKTDVVLLADVFETFRRVSKAHYKLDPAHYYTLPGFSWDSGLKMTGAVIGCLYDGQPDALEMLDMLQRGVRGGVSVVSTRYAAANNPYLSGYDAAKPSTYIINLDANNLYGGGMMEALPIGSYALERIADSDEGPADVGADEAMGGAVDERVAVHAAELNAAESPEGEGAALKTLSVARPSDDVDSTEDSVYANDGSGVANGDSDDDCADCEDAKSYGWSECDEGVNDEFCELAHAATQTSLQRTTATCLAEVLRLEPNVERGCFCEVDLTIPRELHDALNDYPPAPESVCFEPSPLMAALRAELRLPVTREPKLSPNLQSKTCYVVHYRALQTYVRLGCVVTRVHKILWFRQSPYLAPYIQYNTERRKAAKTTLEKDVLKLMNNAIFGKTCENVENRLNIILATDGATIARYASRPTFLDLQLIGCGLVAIHLRTTSVLFNKPLAVGVAVLDISKTFMYDFHYGYVRRTYGDRARLLFTDTDSLTYVIETADVYADMAVNLTLFDTSDYPRDHACFSETNKKVVLKMKDEHNGVPVRAFVGLRSKMYCFLTDKDTAEPTAKGVVRAERDRLTWALYEAALFGLTTEEKQQTVSFSTICSRGHQVSTLCMSKTSLCAYDDKRYVLDDNVHTLAHGHWRIAAQRTEELYAHLKAIDARARPLPETSSDADIDAYLDANVEHD